MKSNKAILIYLTAILIVVFMPLFVDAQVEQNEPIKLTARINDPLVVNIDNSEVIFEFNTMSDYQNGKGGINSEYETKAKIQSSSNLTLKCIPLAGDYTNENSAILPSDLIGYSATINSADHSNSTKLNKLSDGDASNLALTNSDQKLKETDLSIFWEIGTNNVGSENLMSRNLKAGTYSTQVMLVIAEEI